MIGDHGRVPTYPFAHNQDPKRKISDLDVLTIAHFFGGPDING
jgi:hypothetical protein